MKAKNLPSFRKHRHQLYLVSPAGSWHDLETGYTADIYRCEIGDCELHTEHPEDYEDEENTYDPE